MPERTSFTTRRVFLQSTAASAAISTIPAWAQPALPEPLEQYKPQFFTAEEWAFVMAATARLIPPDDNGPSAIETRVPVFIDRQLAGDFGKAADWYMAGPHVIDGPPQLGYQSPLTPAEVYRAGIAELNDWCRNNHDGAFEDLGPDAQDGVLQALEKGEITLSSTKGASLFDLLLQNTKEGYFADPMYGGNHNMAAWVYIGFPGARAAFLEWVGVDKRYPLGPVSISGERV